MSDLYIRAASQADLEQILKVYAYARQFMIENGNPTQWKDGYPAREILLDDISRGLLYVVVKQDRICGVFYFAIEEDPTYAHIDGGSWRSNAPYGVIHRVAGDGSGGVFRACFDFCHRVCDHLRIDTHENNHVMQHVVTKAGFVRRGIIITHDGTPRIAYDMI